VRSGALQHGKAAAQTPEGKGEALVRANGCLGCHSIDGTKLIGPTWEGLFGSPVELSDGSTVTSDEEYISESILNPSAKIVAGYEAASAMPPYSFTQEELGNIIAYLTTLR
jgi:cytochrome c oxidase subunit 2